MKFMIVLFAAALAVVQTFAAEEPVPIVKQSSDIRPDGFEYQFETGNGIIAEEKGELKNAGSPETSYLETQGQYKYTAPDGQIISIVYTADANGYHPVGDSIPTSPPIPEEIQKALAYIASLPPSTETPKH